MVFLPLEEHYLTPPSVVRGWASAVADAVEGLDVAIVEQGENPAPHLAGADAVFGTLTPPLLAAAPQIVWLQAPAAAPIGPFFFDELIEHPVVVTNLRGVYRDNLADQIMACVLSFARRLDDFAAAQRRHQWRRDLGSQVVDLAATTMLLVGVGNVGAAVAQRARPFGIRLVGVDAKPGSVEAPLDALYDPSALDELLPRAGWVVVTVPHTPETTRLMSPERLRAMKRGAYLINVGRGETVDEDALADALDAGRLAGAALDVFSTEPLPAGHRLWDTPNLIITPHVAGYGRSTDTEREELIVDNARRFAAGQPLRNIIDKRLRY